MKISVIICTKNRETELIRCLKSIQKQTRLPYEIIIVDDGNLDTFDINNILSNKPIRYKYFKKTKSGLTVSRNLGIKYAIGDLISFLDDDVVLFKNYFKELVKFLKQDTGKVIGGVDGFIVNKTKYSLVSNFIRKLFFLTSQNQGKVLLSGFYSEIYDLKKPQKVDLLSGCAIYRSEVFEKFRFDESFYKGYAFGEDKDFSFRVGRCYSLFAIPSAKMYHLRSKKSRPSSFDLGVMDIAHRIRFYVKYSNKSLITILSFLWAMFGYIGINFLNGLFLKQSICQFFGNVVGILSYFLKQKNNDMNLT